MYAKIANHFQKFLVSSIVRRNFANKLGLVIEFEIKSNGSSYKNAPKSDEIESHKWMYTRGQN